MSASRTKLGLAIIWPAFWTGVPIKIVLVLLFLSMGVHPWEMPGLAFLLLLSIPIDIWALNLVSRTVFLEQLKLDPPEGLGVNLWAQVAAVTAVYGWIAFEIESGTIALAKGMAAGVMELLKGIPVAERIGIELVMWGSVATAVLIVLVLGWLHAIGWVVDRQARSARPVQRRYPEVVQQVDLMRVPADQPLMLTVFVATSIVLVLLLWTFMPVSTPHPHEEYKKAAETVKAPKPLKPSEVIQRTETVIAQAEASVKALEAQATGKPSAKPAGQGKPPAGESKAGGPGPGKADGTTASVSGKAGGHDETPHSH